MPGGLIKLNWSYANVCPLDLIALPGSTVEANEGSSEVVT
jgi:hypothetical protein